MGIVSVILETRKKYDITIADCRGPGFDNRANMFRKYSGAQSHIRFINLSNLYSHCVYQCCHKPSLLAQPQTMVFASDLLVLCFNGHMKRKTSFTCLVELLSFDMMLFSVSFYDLNLPRYGALKSEKGTFISDAIRTRSDRRCDVIGLTGPFDTHWNLCKWC